MNLGQVIGEMQLRIYELEAQLEESGKSHIGRRLNLMPRVRALLAEHVAMTIDEIATHIPDVDRSTIAKNMQVQAAQGTLRRWSSEDGRKLYALPETLS